MIEDVRHLPIEERLKYFQEKLAELIQKTDVTQHGKMHYGMATQSAEIVLLDLQDAEQLRAYNLRRVPSADAPKKEEPPEGTPPPPANPLAN